MNKQSAILTEQDFRAAISKQCGMTETHVEKFDREIGLDQESAASWRKRWEAEIKDRDCDDRCQYSPDGKERPANDPEDLETWQYLSERQGAE